MIRLFGIIKVASVLTVDFLAVYALFYDPAIACVITTVVGLYAWLGGYLALIKEEAVRADKLPSCERSRMEGAKRQLVEDVKRTSATDISGLKLYLIPGDNDMHATAYGANCVSVSKGIFDSTDPMTLNAVLGHELSHNLHYDPELSRAVFATILLICGVISVVSFAFMVVVFLIFFVCSFLRSFLGVIAFRGTTRAVSCIFSLFQKGIVLFYRAVASCLSRAAEYRADLYSAQLGYGLQLAHFLSYAAPESHRQLTLKRVARLEAYINNETYLMTK